MDQYRSSFVWQETKLILAQFLLINGRNNREICFLKKEFIFFLSFFFPLSYLSCLPRNTEKMKEEKAVINLIALPFLTPFANEILASTKRSAAYLREFGTLLSSAQRFAEWLLLFLSKGLNRLANHCVYDRT